MRTNGDAIMEMASKTGIPSLGGDVIDILRQKTGRSTIPEMCAALGVDPPDEDDPPPAAPAVALVPDDSASLHELAARRLYEESISLATAAAPSTLPTLHEIKCAAGDRPDAVEPCQAEDAPVAKYVVETLMPALATLSASPGPGTDERLAILFEELARLLRLRQ